MPRRPSNPSRPNSDAVFCACGGWPATAVVNGKRVCEKCKDS